MKKLIAILALIVAIAAGVYIVTRGDEPAVDSKAEAEKIKSLGYAH